MSKPDVLVATIEHATASGTYRTEDAGATWKQMSRTNPRPMYYSKPTIDPNNDKHVWLPGTSIVHSVDGGATFIEEPTSATYDLGLKTDHHVLRVDPANSNHIYVVGDGGLHESFDMGKTYIASRQHSRGAGVPRRRWTTAIRTGSTRACRTTTRGWARAPRATGSASSIRTGSRSASATAPARPSTWPTGRKVYSSSSGGNLSLVDPVTGDTLAITPAAARGRAARTASTGTRR